MDISFLSSANHSGVRWNTYTARGKIKLKYGNKTQHHFSVLCFHIVHLVKCVSWLRRLFKTHPACYTAGGNWREKKAAEKKDSRRYNKIKRCLRVRLKKISLLQVVLGHVPNVNRAACVLRHWNRARRVCTDCHFTALLCGMLDCHRTFCFTDGFELSLVVMSSSPDVSGGNRHSSDHHSLCCS